MLAFFEDVLSFVSMLLSYVLFLGGCALSWKSALRFHYISAPLTTGICLIQGSVVVGGRYSLFSKIVACFTLIIWN